MPFKMIEIKKILHQVLTVRGRGGNLMLTV